MKLKRALWLAFQASSPMGMGFLHAATADKQTEDSLFEQVQPNEGKVYTDYVCGRMMKTDFRVDADGKLTIRPEEPRTDYQSWGATYRTATALIAAVEKSFA